MREPMLEPAADSAVATAMQIQWVNACNMTPDEAASAVVRKLAELGYAREQIRAILLPDERPPVPEVFKESADSCRSALERLLT